jgi:hypothetical protein
VFVKSPEEPKPVYLDFDSPLYVDLFCRMARQAARLAVTEMIPAVDEVWLSDAQGDRYTCELRVAIVDPLAWSPAGAGDSDREGPCA